MRVAAGALGAWALLWHGPWHLWLEPWPALRLVLATIAFCLPGLTLAMRLGRGRRAGLAGHLTLGFALSVGLTAMLGLAAKLWELTFGVVTGGLFWIGVGGLLALDLPALAHRVSRRTRRLRQVSPGTVAAVALPLMAAAVAAAVLTARRGVGGDDYAYGAALTNYLDGQRLAFSDVLFAADEPADLRFWLMLWPLAEAVLASRAGLHALEITGLHLAPVLAVLSLLGVFALARALGCSRQLAGLVTAAQLAGLAFLLDRQHVGHVFLFRLPEDKVTAAFVLAPVFLRAVVGLLAGPTRQWFALAALAGIGLTACSPTIALLTVGISGAYAALDAWAQRRVRPLLAFGALAAITLAAPAGLRFDPGSYRFEVASRKLNPDVARRLTILDDQRFYGASTSNVRGAPFALAALVAVAAVPRVRRSAAARYVVAAHAVLGLTLVPYTGWLLGLAITPDRIWRIAWLVPLGISAGVLVGLWPRLDAPAAATRYRHVARRALLPATALALVAIAADRIAGHPTVQQEKAWTGGIPDLVRLGRVLDVVIEDRAVVLGADLDANNVVPSLSAKAKVMTFRPKLERLGKPGGVRGSAEWWRMTRVDTPEPERLRLLEANRVRFILADGEPEWVSSLARHPAAPLRRIATFGHLHLYEVCRPPDAMAARPVRPRYRAGTVPPLAVSGTGGLGLA